MTLLKGSRVSAGHETADVRNASENSNANVAEKVKVKVGQQCSEVECWDARILTHHAAAFQLHPDLLLFPDVHVQLGDTGAVSHPYRQTPLHILVDIAEGDSNLNAVLTNGGPQALAWGIVIVVFGAMAQSASLAEMASMQPIAGAQYHWTSYLAPQRQKRFITWMQGMVR